MLIDPPVLSALIAWLGRSSRSLVVGAGRSANTSATASRSSTASRAITTVKVVAAYRRVHLFLLVALVA